MSGIEVAGLVLGAIPILTASIDEYRNSARKLKSGFRRRKTIEKLGRALRFQKTIVEAITRNVLTQSGCEDAAGSSDAQLMTLLQDKYVEHMVYDLLGNEHAQTFLDALLDCLSSVSHATRRLASLVPELNTIKNEINIQAILKANDACVRGPIQVFARLTLVFNLENLEDEIEALDKSTNSLDKFARIVITDSLPGQKTASRSAIKLAKTLRRVRGDAIHLHTTLTREWTDSCHARHELKLFLEDRTSQSRMSTIGDDSIASCFKVLFVGGTPQPTQIWHETTFHTIQEDHTPTSDLALPLKAPFVSIVTPQPYCTPPKVVVDDICRVISSCKTSKQHSTFYLNDQGAISMALLSMDMPSSKDSPTSSTTLREVLSNGTFQPKFSTSLPWKIRMNLALKTASGFLQFIRTPWVQPLWSAANIRVLSTNDNTHGVHLDRPFISCDFRKIPSQPIYERPHFKDDLLDLGILLLEIWHETSFESLYGPQLSLNKRSSALRRACALEWLQEFQNPLSEYYFRAASHCISGVLTATDPRSAEWDHLDTWKAICENVVDPLLKVARI